MSQIQQEPSPPAEPPGPAMRPPAAADDDPLSHLHRMSTTAGLGSGEYVAINGTAVFAFIVGLASALCLFEEVVLLLVPLVGIVTAIVAINQITKSNGTQTGRALAVVGLVLSVAFGGWVVFRKATERSRQAADRAAIETLIKQYGEVVREGKFDQAYGLFSSRFAERVPPQTFADRMKFVHETPSYGKLESAGWNGLVEFDADPGSGAVGAVASIQLNFEKAPQIRQDAFFRKERGTWRIDNLPDLFPPPERQQQQPPPGAR
jgi:hypothetical protein